MRSPCRAAGDLLPTPGHSSLLRIFPIHLFQRFHAHVAFYAPLSASDVPQPCTDQHQRRFSIREGSNHSRPSPNFAVQTFQHVVGSDLQPVLGGECVVGQRFLNAIAFPLNAFSMPEFSAKSKLRSVGHFAGFGAFFSCFKPFRTTELLKTP